MIKINCELCGKKEDLVKALIEGVELNVCQACGKFGKVLATVKRYTPKEQHIMLKKSSPKEKTELIVEDYAEIIKKKREQLGLSQKDFANKINEKESLIHNIETGHLEPSLALARKLEKMLGIKLVEAYEAEHEKAKTGKVEGFTLGDFIKVKK